jgi:flagella basal body P-ring formation protein FlgA
MKSFLFIITITFLCVTFAEAEDIYIKEDTLFLEQIIGAKIEEPVLSGLNIGDRVLLPKERVRSILYRLNLLDKYGEYVKDYTVIRQGQLLREEDIKELILSSLRKKFPDLTFKVEKISYNNNIYYQDKRDVKIKFPKLTFGSVYFDISNGSKTYNIYAYIRAFKDTIVAKTNISNNMPLEGNVEVSEAEVTDNYNNLVKGVDNLITKKTIKKGEPILNQYTREKPELRSNSSVRLLYRGKYITVETTGVLKNDAYLNKAVKVENPTSRKIISAIYIGNGTALVQ